MQALCLSFSPYSALSNSALSIASPNSAFLILIGIETYSTVFYQNYPEKPEVSSCGDFKENNFVLPTGVGEQPVSPTRER